MEKQNSQHLKEDPTAESRKKDHIVMAFDSAVGHHELDRRFYYEPVLSGLPKQLPLPTTDIFGYSLKTPIWISSMTGGTEMAKTINQNLARAADEFGMGMGLGSCRALLFDDDRLDDFAVRKYMPNTPLFANLGVAQIEELMVSNQLSAISDVVKKLDADGLIIHINPMQEWLQPEGDRYQLSPLEMIRKLIDHFPDLKIIVKEVGQGMGIESLKALYQLPIEAVDFAAGGGTNFAKLELLRSAPAKQVVFDALSKIGHTATEMVDLANSVIEDLGDRCLCKNTIISGGIKDFLDGYYHIEKINSNAIYGQASGFLKHATEDYSALQQHVVNQLEGLKVANSFLTVR